MSEQPAGPPTSTPVVPGRAPRQISRWIGLAILLVAIVLGARVAGVRLLNAVRRPSPQDLNVLLITVDTTRADYLGCYGRSTANTPNIDALAREGVMFKRCSTCVSLTLPSHSSIMTSTYPFVHKVRRNGADRLADDYLTLAEELKSTGRATTAIVASFVINHQFGLDQGFDEYHDVPTEQTDQPMRAERRGDDIAQDAIASLRKLASKKFFLWVHFYDPHYPYASEERGHTIEGYEEDITFMDTQIGHVVDELRKLRLDRKTLVVLVGDHGEGLLDHGEFQHSFFVWETTLHVPLIFRCPGVVPEGRVVDAQVRTIDVAPTILDLVDAEPLPAAEGVSLRPVLSGELDDPGLLAYAESLEAYIFFKLSALRSLSAGAWKYVHGHRPALYNVEDDPGEQHNRIDEFPDLAASLEEQLRDLVANAPTGTTDNTAVSLSAHDQAALESLGYLAGDVTKQPTSEMEFFDPQDADPQDYTRAITIHMLATGALSDKKYDVAADLLRQVVERMPSALLPRVQLAEVYEKLERQSDALAVYHQAVADGVADVETRSKYASRLVDAGRWNDAIAQLTVVLAETPDDFDAQFNMGVALGSEGRFTDAGDYFQRALELAPDDARVLHGVGVYYARQGMYERAIEYFRKALKIDPDHEKAKRDLDAALERLSRE